MPYGYGSSTPRNRLYEAIEQPDNRNRRLQSIGRMVERVMILDAVLSDRRCWWLSPEADKRTFFDATHESGLRPEEYPHITFASGSRTVRCFPDKLPIGVEKEDSSRFVLLYLVNRRLPVDFRQFLLRHQPLLLNLHRWTLRLLVPRRVKTAVALCKAALREELWTPLNPSVSNALETYFRERRERGGHLGDPPDRYIGQEFRKQRSAKIAAPYRAWRREGDVVLWRSSSTCLRDDRMHGCSACEVQFLNAQYLQLTGAMDREARARRGPSENRVRLAPRFRHPLWTFPQPSWWLHERVHRASACIAALCCRHATEAALCARLTEMVGAVIYVRVSTKEQTENLSLPTQLRACEEYCRRQGFEILQRFHEQGESAKTIERTELQNLLKYCRTHKGKVHFVIVYNLTRFAREKYDHFALRAHLNSLGISLRSATEPIDDTSTGKLMEGVLAAFAQFDNDVRSDRTRAGMRAALEFGRWTFPAPLGYLNAPKWSGASLVHDPDRAELVKRAFEDLATGRYTKPEVIARATAAGLRSRKGLPLSPQSFGQMMRNPICIGKIESPDYGVSTRGDFEPVVNEATFYRAQAVLDDRVVVSGPRQRNHPDFPLRGFVRCDVCGRPLTGSWSKGRDGHYAYYHCQRQCRAVNVSKAALEGAFVDELALLQPTPGYMRLVKDRILHVWEQRRAEANERTTEQERRVKVIQQKLDRLDEAFLYSESIDLTSYSRQRDKPREEVTLAKIEHHTEAVDELDVEGILAFAECILPRASDLWVQASLDYKQRLQQLFFPEGIAFDGNRFNRTAATAPPFNYLAPSESADERVVSRVGIEPNRF
jgi:site-specific DNA recombinase